jgi:hypothetical protein
MHISRQVRRQQEREQQKLIRLNERHHARATAQRERLDRQTIREKSGFYSGTPSVASVMAPSRSRLTTRKVNKGTFGGRIIKVINKITHELQLHATKGWRTYRA